jgi:hypothetical protein
VFYSQQSNAIDYVRSGPTAPYQASNLTGLHFTGVEGSYEWRPNASEDLKADWTLLFGAQDALHGLQSDYVSNYATNNSSLQWTQSFQHVAGLLLRSRLGVTQRYQQTAYAVWDVQLARGWAAASVFADVEFGEYGVSGVDWDSYARAQFYRRRGDSADTPCSLDCCNGSSPRGVSQYCRNTRSRYRPNLYPTSCSCPTCLKP